MEKYSFIPKNEFSSDEKLVEQNKRADIETVGEYNLAKIEQDKRNDAAELLAIRRSLYETEVKFTIIGSSYLKEPLEKVLVGNEVFFIRQVPKEEIYPTFGYGGGAIVGVREDLPPKVKRFVTAHELYHSTDKYSWGGWVGREIRANFTPALKDPAGFLATVKATLFDLDRLKFYLDRFRKGF